MEIGDRFYRYENFGTSVQECMYYVVKITPNGCRVCFYSNGVDFKGKPAKTHLVLNRSNKKFAYPENEKELALASFFIRKKKEVEHLIHRFTFVDSILKDKERIVSSLKKGSRIISARIHLATNDNKDSLDAITVNQREVGYYPETGVQFFLGEIEVEPDYIRLSARMPAVD